MSYDAAVNDLLKAENAELEADNDQLRRRLAEAERDRDAYLELHLERWANIQSYLVMTDSERKRATDDIRCRAGLPPIT